MEEPGKVKQNLDSQVIEVDHPKTIMALIKVIRTFLSNVTPMPNCDIKINTPT